MLRTILIVLIIVSSPFLFSQTIKGIILEKETNLPLTGAHIYIINSLQGTVSGANGEFKLVLPNTYGELLITYVGYKNKKVAFNPKSNNLSIGLTPLPNQLKEVSVKSTKDKKWKRLYKKFESSFLGETQNANSCIITNPWVVDITKGASGELIAKSTLPIEIINNALGYKLLFYLTDFTLKSNRLHYQGDVYFNELAPKLSTDKSMWSKNRIETFLGSKRHFIIAMNSKRIEQQGFEVYSASFNPQIGFTTKKRINKHNLLKVEHNLSIPDYLKIIYTKAAPQHAYWANNQSQSSFTFQGPKTDLVPKGNLQMETQSIETQISYLYSRNSKLLFTDNGLIINSQYIIEYGYWSWLGVAEMLPYEYEFKLEND